ncbi:MAG: SUMF1/EgtB/PvdO family nonheme iron enzyme [Syntrophales bacterium]|nr:SUMF1/EgtB/PvdO family nonheme iron enzyme [Syntrophales bacterium]
MRAKGLLILIALSVFVLNGQAWPGSPWLNLPSDARDVVRKVMIDELNKQPGVFSTPQEDTANWTFIEEEKNREDEVYRENVDKARQAFVRAKNMRDDLAAQVRSLSTDSDDTLDQIKTIRTTIENIDKSLIRWNQDLKTHEKSFETGLGAESQGSALVAVTYTVDAKDTQNTLDKFADQTSISLLAAERKGTYQQSLAKALGNVLSEDFIRGMMDGAFVASGDKPLLIVLAKDIRGVTYLRLKRYDFFLFQKPKSGQFRTQGDSPSLPAAVMDSLDDFKAFLKKANYSLSGKIFNDAEGLIRDTGRANIQAEERLNEQIRSFREKRASLEKKITDSRNDLETWAATLKKQESLYEPIRQDLNKIRVKMEAAERLLKEAQSALQEKMRFQAAIIPVRDAAFLKSSQTPVEAAAEAIVDKLAEVKNDAKAQYSRYTREAAQVLMTDKKAEPADTDTRIVGVKLLSFVGEGDMVRIKVALRVQTTLREETPSERKEAVTDPIKAIEFVLIKGGCFQMGDLFGDGQADEKPDHAVCVGDYYLGKYEVTQGQWQSVMGNNPSFFKDCGEKCPVEQVSWNDIQEFIKKLNSRTKKNYRLPTEAEWEFAARNRGMKEKYAGTSSDGEVGKYAWYSANSNGRTHPTGEKQPNRLGLYDMTGNVWEWCQDWYGEKYYSQSPGKNPPGPQSGMRRVLRGGAWLFEPAGIRAATRYGLTPASRSDLYGFRLSISISQ